MEKQSLDHGSIRSILAKWGSYYHNIFIPEFTWGGLRIDAIIIDLSHRWVRGFEIKASRSDFLKDDKFTLYTQFCSSLSIVCPEGVVQPEEIEKPFGLVWVYEKDKFNYESLRWVKRPKNFQKRRSMAWVWTYIQILETEFPRMQFALNEACSKLLNGGS